MWNGNNIAELMAPGMDWASVRILEEDAETLSVRRDLLQPVRRKLDRGAMVQVRVGAGQAYAATPDTSANGLRKALLRARDLAQAGAAHNLVDARSLPRGARSGSYRSPVRQPWAELSLGARVEILHSICQSLAIDPRIVDREASLMLTLARQHFLDSDGSVVDQEFALASPDIVVTAHADGQTQRRSHGLRGYCRQGGVEILEEVGFRQEGRALAEEAVALLSAPEAPSGTMDLLLAPDQMMLQIHESIGHPLELDRILGDERNFAGTSFVKLDMFGSYRYGSELLNVTFDPTVPGEYASYAFDAEGTPAERVYLIRDGLLERPLGGATSQARAGMAGTANGRASSWNRPPIDRMANLNIEPGNSSFDDMVRSVERGIYMRTNCSWSIDDARNKFQFGCEWAQMIEEGRLTKLVRNPCYRGISATFWRSLKGVGARETVSVLGTPWCGKGEPAQIIRVGHASPVCLFEGVDVFGGES